MCNDVSRDDATKLRFVSKLSVVLKKVDKKCPETTRESKKNSVKAKFKQELRAVSKVTSIKTSAKTEKDAVKTKLKEDRDELVSHFYNIIGITRDENLFCSITDSNIATTSSASNSPSDSEQWLDSYDQSYDYDLEFCGRKTSDFCGTKRRQRYNSKREKEFHDRRNQNITLRKEHKKVSRNKFYNKRKKQLALDRKAASKTKLENLGITVQEHETFELEYDEFMYLENSTAEKFGLEFALCEENAPDELQSDILDFLLGLQDRDITPEDYEFLLRLDESVPTKTVPNECVASLKTDTVFELHVDEQCGVCMENYVVGETRKILPCEHVFHANCIETWLRHNSTKCPLDNIEV
jgi:hypothetical protein